MSDYFDILSERLSTNEGKWTIHLRPGADVYRGHFPGEPIAPGACNIEMIRLLTSRLSGHTCRYQEISQCRFTHLIKPDTHNPIDVQITLSGDRVQASIYWGETPCVTLKATISHT